MTVSERARVRIGDAERDAAAAALGEHFASGRLTRHEFDERLEHAWAAKTAAELDPLFVDLPRAGEVRPPALTGRGEPVGFSGDRRSRAVGPRWRTPFGLPPIVALVLAVVLVITVASNLPIILFVLGALWFTGVIGNRGRGSFGCMRR